MLNWFVAFVITSLLFIFVWLAGLLCMLFDSVLPLSLIAVFGFVIIFVHQMLDD